VRAMQANILQKQKKFKSERRKTGPINKTDYRRMGFCQHKIPIIPLSTCTKKSHPTQRLPGVSNRCSRIATAAWRNRWCNANFHSQQNRKIQNRKNKKRAK
jgi:hypothetical protein